MAKKRKSKTITKITSHKRRKPGGMRKTVPVRAHKRISTKKRK